MMTKISVKQAIIINLPVTDVFAYMSNLENMANWSSVIVSTQIISSEGLGTMASSRLRFLGTWSEITLQVVECEPARVLTLKSISGVAPCMFHYQFERLDNERTSVAQDIMVSLIGDMKDSIQQIITNALRRDARHDLLTLKDILETGAHTYFSAARA